MSDQSVATGLHGSQAPFPDPIPGIIPFGSVTVVAGASGAGKTILFADWLQKMRTGQPICHHPSNPSSAYYIIAADRNWSTYHKAYSAAGFPEIDRYVLAEDPLFDPQSWGRKSSSFTLFEDCLKKLSPIPGSWVSVDPVAPLFIQGNQNDARDVALSLHWYRKMALKYQITLCLFANVGKQKAEDTYKRAQDRIAGSGAFVAYSDTQVSVEQSEEGILSMRWTPRNAPAEEHQFKFDPESRLFAPYQDPHTVAREEDIPTHLAEALALVPVLPATITSPDLVRKICAECGVKRAMAFRHVQQLIDKGIIERDRLSVVRRVDRRVPEITVDPVDST